MLDQKLEAYAKSRVYPFHMPGHKRGPISLPNPYTIDITEIDGFDNLHEPKGIIKEAQERAAKLYGSKKSYYLVNGSTCGILAAISAAVPLGGKLLMARNAHKSVYHGAYLRGLATVYLNPPMTGFDIQGSIRPQEVLEKLEQHPDIKAVILTSPGYEGVVSNIPVIAEIAHKHEIPLIVDEAHGAHFGFHPAFPDTAIHQNADLVVQSMHKVLPSLTQTALLHWNSKYVPFEAVEKYLSIYQTSSPSYVLMAGMEKCIRLLKERGEELFEAYVKELLSFYKETNDFSALKVIKRNDFCLEEAYHLDLSKITVSVKNADITGTRLYQRLLEDYQLQMELASATYVLGMTSIMDRKEGFDRLLKALKEIDGRLQNKEENEEEKKRVMQILYRPKEKKMELHEAMDLPVTAVSFEEAKGRISGSMVSLYPPGIPILLPGEVIDGAFLENIRKCLKYGLNLQGIADIINEKINIVNS